MQKTGARSVNIYISSKLGVCLDNLVDGMARCLLSEMFEESATSDKASRRQESTSY